MEEARTSGPQSLPDPQADLSAKAIRGLASSLHRSVRGYDPEAVDDVLTRIALRVDYLEKHNASLSDRVNELAKKVFFHEGRAWAVQEALVTAQALKSEAEDRASDVADKLRNQAAREARQLLSAAREEDARLREEASRLRSAVETEASEIKAFAEAYAAKARTAAEEYAATVRLEAERYAESTRTSADEAAAALRREAEEYAEATRRGADTDATTALERAAEEAAQARDHANADATSLLERAEAWAAEEKRRAEEEAEAIREEGLRRLKETRDTAIREIRVLRERAKRDTDKLRRRARAQADRANAQIEQARDDAALIREEVKRETQELRDRVEREAQSLRSLASEDAARIREMAEDAALEREESTRIELLRISTKLQIQIEERHRILERLDARRATLLSRMHAMLTEELEMVDREREHAATDEALSAEEDHGAVVIGMGLEEATSPGTSGSARGVAATAAWSNVIDPETGQVKDAGHGLSLTIQPTDGAPDLDAAASAIEAADGSTDSGLPMEGASHPEGGDEAVQ